MASTKRHLIILNQSILLMTFMAICAAGCVTAQAQRCACCAAVYARNDARVGAAARIVFSLVNQTRRRTQNIRRIS